MFGILGIVLSLALLIGLAYRGWNVIVLAPICATVGLLFGGLDAPVIATYTQVFMPALGNYLIKFFPLFLLGAVFGKLMDDSGCAQTIAHKIVEWTGRERAIIATSWPALSSLTAVCRFSSLLSPSSRSPCRCSARETCRNG